MRLRTRGHESELPTMKYEFNKPNFIVRSLSNYVRLRVISCLIFILYFIVHMCECYVYYTLTYLLTYLSYTMQKSTGNVPKSPKYRAI